jgi:hypothetical protein
MLPAYDPHKHHCSSAQFVLAQKAAYDEDRLEEGIAFLYQGMSYRNAAMMVCLAPFFSKRV